MKESTTVWIAAIFFILIGIVHLSRIFFPFSVIVGQVEIPIWVNVIAYLFCGVMGGFLLRVIRNCDPYKY